MSKGHVTQECYGLPVDMSYSAFAEMLVYVLLPEQFEKDPDQ